jgi:hypothetical protein
MDLVPPSGEARETPTLLGPLERANLSDLNGPNRIGVSFSSPEDRKRSRFRNVMFSSYLVFESNCKVHKPSDSDSYTPSSEKFRFNVINRWQ